MKQNQKDNYSIMHLDRLVAKIYTDGKALIYYPSFLPFNLILKKGDDLDTRLNNLNNFYYWCSSRMITLNRKYVKAILDSLGNTQPVSDRDRAKMVLSYHAVALSDVYWVKKILKR